MILAKVARRDFTYAPWTPANWRCLLIASSMERCPIPRLNLL